MQDYKTPGVYTEENPHIPPSITSVETAIPAFIGYTEQAQWKEKDDLKNVPWRITSMLQYEQYFGYPDPERESLSVVFEADAEVNARVDETKRSKFLMHYSMQLYFANGGEACWITSVGNYMTREGRIEAQDLKNGLAEVAKINEVTLLVFPDSINLRAKEEYYDVHTQAILQCVFLRDRFTVMDVYHTADNLWTVDISDLRTGLVLTAEELKYAAVYFPKLYTGIDYYYKLADDPTKDNDELINIVGIPDAPKLSDLINEKNAQYLQAKSAVANIQMLLPASAAIVGVYAQIDNTFGVWKAPANINITNVIRPDFQITQHQQEDLNVDAVAGKSINVIRSFAGRGAAIIWGVRTLAGNDNEWRYIPVRRFFNMVEESVKNGTEQFVFEPNDPNTWIKVKSMIENFLTQQWKSGALMGTSTKDAFFVHIGLGETMTELDILENRMIVEIGMAAIRPAEFIILKFTHNMLDTQSNISFPAKLIHTDLSWEDLVINEELKEQINQLKSWLKHNNQLGYRTLFYGPSGSGKTFTAGLLGKEVGKKVYQIDLSMVLSKYIGETEKNLEHLFARAEDKGWILFFDEADALFKKRTDVRDAHDKYANQEISYLLQRIEDYSGIVILATNTKKNIDHAFIRRFNSILKFSC